ncbi:MAG: ATP-binding protein [Actinobacteria bacterium]|nr:ATP-binding protein [Actinomycetota bacterium]
MADRIELQPAPESVAAARRWSVQCVERAGLGALRDTVALLVSEVVSNVVLHARTPCELRVDTDVRPLRVEVRDRSDRLPNPVAAVDPMSASGRGMVLVEALSEAHGSAPLPGGGKVVWFQLAERPRTGTDG